MQFLTSRGVAFQEKDVAADPQAMQELLRHTGGVRATPVIVTADQVIRGFDRDRLSLALDLG